MKSVELSPLAEVALRMYLASVSNLEFDYLMDDDQRRSLMRKAYRDAAEFLEVGAAFQAVPDPEPKDGLLSEYEIELVKKQAVARFGYNVGRVYSFMSILQSIFPDVYEAALDAGFADAMDDSRLPELYSFLRGNSNTN